MENEGGKYELLNSLPEELKVSTISTVSSIAAQNKVSLRCFHVFYSILD